MQPELPLADQRLATGAGSIYEGSNPSLSAKESGDRRDSPGLLWRGGADRDCDGVATRVGVRSRIDLPAAGHPDIPD